jgi:hypothetical protein
MVFGSVPVIYLLHTYASKENPITTMIKSYDDWQEEFRSRNALQGRLEQQAADDRIFFANAGPHSSRRIVEAKGLEYESPARRFDRTY